MFCLAEIPTNPYDWVDTIVKLVTAGGFGALVWYLVVKHIPAIEKRHQQERDEWKEFLSKRDDAMTTVIDRLTASIQLISQGLTELKVEIHAYRK